MNDYLEIGENSENCRHYSKTYTEDCHHRLKPGGIALFREPFAIGYGLLVASRKLAQNDLGINCSEIDALYENISFRAKGSRNQLKKLIDKHLFFQSEMTKLAKTIIFKFVDFKSLLDREYYHHQFVSDELRLSYKINDDPLTKRANEIYKVFVKFSTPNNLFMQFRLFCT